MNIDGKLKCLYLNISNNNDKHYIVIIFIARWQIFDWATSAFGTCKRNNGAYSHINDRKNRKMEYTLTHTHTRQSANFESVGIKRAARIFIIYVYTYAKYTCLAYNRMITAHWYWISFFLCATTATQTHIYGQRLLYIHNILHTYIIYIFIFIW